MGPSYADLFATQVSGANLVGPDMVPGRDLPDAWANPLARAVLDVLHDHAFDGPTCRPSQELIAREIRARYGWPTTRETVNRMCAWLRDRRPAGARGRPDSRAGRKVETERAAMTFNPGGRVGFPMASAAETLGSLP